MNARSKYINENNQKAWVVFTGETDIPWLKFLKDGFRHCFVLINDGTRWISIDPLAPYTDIEIHYHVDSDFDLPDWLCSRGYKVVPSDINKTHKTPAPWMLCSCVESIKRILGIHKRLILTPWQLYQYLIKQNNNIQKIKGDLSWVA